VILANWFRDESAMLRRQRVLKEHFGIEWEYLSRGEMRDRIRSERYHSGLFEPNALHFHPLDYLRGLARVAEARGVRMHDTSPVVSLARDGAGWIVHTAGGSVRAEHVVLSCGGYLAGLRREIDASILPIATYILVTEPLGDRLRDCFGTRAAVYDTRFAFDYYRPLVDTRILWGGRISVRDRSPAQGISGTTRRAHRLCVVRAHELRTASDAADRAERHEPLVRSGLRRTRRRAHDARGRNARLGHRARRCRLESVQPLRAGVGVQAGRADRGAVELFARAIEGPLQRVHRSDLLSAMRSTSYPPHR
jgi:glycine/D-amino acid oxidase-like deaminating enzyme